MERLLKDVRCAGLNPPTPGLTALIDKEQLAHKLEMRAGEVVTHAQQQGFPAPVAYFRGRILWDEAAIDQWLGEDWAGGKLTGVTGGPVRTGRAATAAPSRVASRNCR